MGIFWLIKAKMLKVGCFDNKNLSQMNVIERLRAEVVGESWHKRV
jgi:hypothetical protein